MTLRSRAFTPKNGLDREMPVWVFCTTAGTTFDESEIRKVFARTLRRAELPHFRVYDLRHTFATHLLARGVPSAPSSGTRTRRPPSGGGCRLQGDKRAVDVLDESGPAAPWRPFGTNRDRIAGRGTQLLLLCHKRHERNALTPQTARAAWQPADEADEETAPQVADRAGDVPLRPHRHRASGHPRIREPPRGAAGRRPAQGENAPARRPETHRRRCTGWRDGGRHASRGPRSGPGPVPA